MTTKQDKLNKLKTFSEELAKLKEEYYKIHSEFLKRANYITVLFSLLPEGSAQNIFKTRIDIIVNQIKENEGLPIPSTLIQYKNNSKIEFTDDHMNDLMATLNKFKNKIESIPKLISLANKLIDDIEKILIAPNDLNTMLYDENIVYKIIGQLDEIILTDESKDRLRREILNTLNNIKNLNKNHAKLLSKYPLNTLTIPTRKQIDHAVINTNVLISQYKENIERLKIIEEAEKLLKHIKESKNSP